MNFTRGRERTRGQPEDGFVLKFLSFFFFLFSLVFSYLLFGWPVAVRCASFSFQTFQRASGSHQQQWAMSDLFLCCVGCICRNRRPRETKELPLLTTSLPRSIIWTFLYFLLRGFISLHHDPDVTFVPCVLCVSECVLLWSSQNDDKKSKT